VWTTTPKKPEPRDDDDDEVDSLVELGAVDSFSLPPGADLSIDWGQRAHLHPDGSPRIVERELTVPPELAGLRLDHFIKTQITRLSRTKIQQVISEQLQRANGGTAKPATIVAANDRFVIRRAARQEPPCPRTFTVVVEDPRFYVIDKPAGLPVHSSAKFYFNTLTRVLDERFPGQPELQICHRLDRETSGCLVVAGDHDAASRLKQAFARKTVCKEYVAVVHGDPPWPELAAGKDHVIDLPLRLSQPSDPTLLPHIRMIAGPGCMPSITKVCVIQRDRSAHHTLVRCTLVTGRQHQIRAHLAAVGFPIVGDKMYAHGDRAFMRFCDEGLVPELEALFVLPRHALHAARVTFPHPQPERGEVTAEATIPADMLALI